MKTFLFRLSLALLALAPLPALAQGAPLKKLLQDGLTEEEIHRDPAAAVKHYEAIRNQFDGQRRLAATGLFRLAECYHKLERKKDAIAVYTRVAREFADFADVAEPSRKQLTALGAPVPDPKSSNGDGAPSSDIPALTEDEAKELTRVKALIAHSPDRLNSGDSGNPTPLYIAASRSYVTLARYILDNGGEVNPRPNNRSPLAEAVSKGHLTMVKLLFDRGANQPDRNTLLRLSINEEHFQVAKFLQSQGAKLSSVGVEDLITSKNPVIIETFLPAVLKRPDFDADAALITAARSGSPAVSALLKAGADVNAEKTAGNSAIVLASDNGHTETVAFLLDKGAEAKVPALVGACERGHDAVVKLLLDRGAKADERLPDGSTPLHRACAALGKSRKSELAIQRVLQLLVENTSDINVRDSENRTPLHRLLWSKERGNKSVPVESIKLLLASGADAGAKDDSGRFPIDPELSYLRTRGDESRLAAIAAAKRARPDRGSGIWFEPLYHKKFEKTRNPSISSEPKPAVLNKEEISTDGEIFRLSRLLQRFNLDMLRHTTIRIARLNPGPNQKAEEEIPYADIVQAGDPSKDPMLRWGDLVEYNCVEKLADGRDKKKAKEFFHECGKINVTVSIDETEKSVTVQLETHSLIQPGGSTVGGNNAFSLLKGTGIAQDPRTDPSSLQLVRGSGDGKREISLDLEEPFYKSPLLVDGDRLIATRYPADAPETKSKLSNAVWVRFNDTLLPLLERTQEKERCYLELATALTLALANSSFVLPHPDLSKIGVEPGDGSPPTLSTLKQIAENHQWLNWGYVLVLKPLPDTDPITWKGCAPETVNALYPLVAFPITIVLDGDETRTLKIAPTMRRYSFEDQVWTAKSSPSFWLEHESTIDIDSIVLKDVFQKIDFDPTQYNIGYLPKLTLLNNNPSKQNNEPKSFHRADEHMVIRRKAVDRFRVKTRLGRGQFPNQKTPVKRTIR